MIEIVTFEQSHIPRAMEIALENYNEERQIVPSLPEAHSVPDLSPYAGNGLGVAAVQGGELVGYLCVNDPFEGAFGNIRGIFSPIHANGAVARDRDYIYDRLYQAAAGGWVDRRILSHAISLYAHDTQALTACFQNGFGQRTSDAMRRTDTPISTRAAADPWQVCPLPEEGLEELSPLVRGYRDHMRGAPIFMPDGTDVEKFRSWLHRDSFRHIFVARAKEGEKAGKVAAFSLLSAVGETFVDDGVPHVEYTFADPRYRGMGASVAILKYIMAWLQQRGYSHCGVDFETFNYTARRFWSKHFPVFSLGVVRRIDERILGLHPEK